jgi:hypothetical protein
MLGDASVGRQPDAGGDFRLVPVTDRLKGKMIGEATDPADSRVGRHRNEGGPR